MCITFDITAYKKIKLHATKPHFERALYKMTPHPSPIPSLITANPEGPHWIKRSIKGLVSIRPIIFTAISVVIISSMLRMFNDMNDNLRY